MCTSHGTLRRVPHKSGTSIFERLARAFCVHSCCVLCVKYARVQNKCARSKQCRISVIVFQFRKQITAKKSSRYKLFVFPMKNGTGIYIQVILLSFTGGGANMLTTKFCHFYTQTTVMGRKESGGFVFPSKNGTRMHIQIIRWVTFGVGKYVITNLHCFVPP